MKNLFTLFFLTTAFFINAQTAEVIGHAGSDVFKVFFESEDYMDVKIALKARTGRTLLTQELTSSGFMKPFNLQNLPDGSYTFIISFSDKVVERPVTLGTPKVTKAKKDRRTKMKAEDRIMIAENAQDVEISLVDESIEALSIFFYLEDTEDFEYFYWEPSGSKTQSYDLSKFEASQIRIEIVENGKILAEREIAKNW